VEVALSYIPAIMPGSIPEYGDMTSREISVTLTPGIGFIPKFLSTNAWE
jgi:hypothetical protein